MTAFDVTGDRLPMTEIRDDLPGLRVYKVEAKTFVGTDADSEREEGVCSSEEVVKVSLCG